MKFIISIAILITVTLLPSLSRADEPFRVVTTLSSYADIVHSIGGERVEVTSVASPKFNPHFIEPRPSDVLKLKRADLFIHSGLDLEAWRDPLLDAAARSELRYGGARQLDLSVGIPLLEVPEGQVSRAEGDIHQAGNPHYWIDPRNGLIIAQRIATKLSELDVAGKATYENNLRVFEEKLQAKTKEWLTNAAPHHGKTVIGYHNEWPYLMQFLGVRMEEFIEPKPGIPPGPRHLEELVEYIKRTGTRAVVQTSFYPREAADYLRKKTSVNTITLCQNVGETPNCPDYISMIDFAVKELMRVLANG